jgi:CheY-like chemotaxis protein
VKRILVVDDSPTIRKVVCSILQRHGYEASTAADGELALDALSGGQKVDLILLDFVMPKMNGYQFCRALRMDPVLRHTPVVLMSAKSDRIREQFVEHSGALDSITKPFDAQALVAVIENALLRVADGRAPEPPSSMLSGEFPPASRAPSTPSDATRLRVRDAAGFGAHLAALVAPALAMLPVGALASQDQIGHAIQQTLSPEVLASFGAALRELDFDVGAPGAVVLAGDVARLPIGAILQLLQMENQTGVLVVTHGKSEITTTMRKGLIELVQSHGAGDEFRLGRFFVEATLVTPREIEELVTARGDGAQPLGDLLVKSAKVTDAQLRAALLRQSSELIYEILRWKEGRFVFKNDPPPTLAASAGLGLPVASVVMEGVRRVDEWRVMEAKVGTFEEVLVRDAVAIEAMGDQSIPRGERTVLEAINGERTIREIIHLTHMSSFDACKILYQFLEARLVRKRAA